MELHSKLVFPNPFRPVGIEFRLEHEAAVTLEILDESGKTLGTPFAQKSYAPGTHTVQIEIQSASRASFYRLSAQSDGRNLSETKRLLVARPDHRV